MLHVIVTVMALALSWPGRQTLGTAPAPIIRQVPTHQKVMALTFDDGPSPRWTPKILTTLTQAHVRATFFLIGSHATRYPQEVRDEIQAHMEIGSHGAEHLVLRRESAAAIRQEIESNAQILHALGAPSPRLYRLPGGASDPTALRVLGSLGYTVVGWSIDTRDWRHQASAQAMAAQVERQAHPGAIVIFHDGPNGSQATVEAVRLLIPALKAQGYRFVTVGQLLTVAQPARSSRRGAASTNR